MAALAPSSPAQLRQTTATFLDHHPQPGVHALGEATVALDGYAGAIGINPGGIGSPGVFQAGTNVSQDSLLGSSWHPSLFDDAVWIASPSVSVQLGRFAGGAQVTYFAREVAVRQHGRIGGDADEIDRFGWTETVAGTFDLNPTSMAGAAVDVASRFLSQGRPLLRLKR